MNTCSISSSEVIHEILWRLPAKSLVRFTSVCRLWKSIITIPQFRLASNRPTRLLVHTNRECYTVVEDEEVADVVFETDFPLRHIPYESVFLLGSDNGLICMAIHTFSFPPYENVYTGFIVWNPFIRKHVAIPDHLYGNDLVYSYGFGATTSGLDHKFVMIVGYLLTVDENDENGGTEQKAFHIYSLKAGTWRRFFLDYDSYLTRSFSYKPALLRGRLHWVVDEPNSNYISTFDLENEVFENNAMMLPQHLSTASTFEFMQDVTVIKESQLAVTAFEYRKNCSLWVMQEYGDVSSWVKLWNIDQTREDFKMFQHTEFRMLKNGNLLLRLCGRKCPPKLVTCDPKTMKTKDFGGGVLSPTEVCGFTNYYKESLVLLADDDRAVPDHKMLSVQPNNDDGVH